MTLKDTITSTFVPVHREGWRFVAIFAVIALVLFWLGAEVLGWIGVILTAWCAYFFRDPEHLLAALHFRPDVLGAYAGRDP